MYFLASNSRKIRGLLLFAVLYGLWLFSFWPAISSVWWYADDFWMMERRLAGESSQIYGLAHQAGRPVTALLFLLHSWATDQHHPERALAVRLLQGAAHVLTTCLLFHVFRRRLPYGPAILCALPFLLWGFNGEATLWFGGIQHVFGALFSVVGYLLVDRGEKYSSWGWKAAGGGFCACAMLANQNPATACLLLWIWDGLAGWETEERNRPAQEQLPEIPPHFIFAKIGRHLDLLFLRKKAWPWLGRGWSLLCGLGLGAIISYYLLYRFQYHRSQGQIVWLDKLAFVVELNRYIFLWPEFYPKVLRMSGYAFLAAIATTMLFLFLTRPREWWRITSAVLFLLAAAVLPYLANLLIPGNWPSFRILYLGPMAVGCVGAWLFLFWRNRIFCQIVLSVLLFSINWHYVWLARHNAPNYPKLYQADLATLRQIEEAARTKEIREVLVLAGEGCPWPFELNPYGIRYYHYDAFRSNFHTPWTPHAFIRLHSDVLQARGNEFDNRERVRSYRDWANQLPPGPPYFRCEIAPDNPRLLLVIPR